jgi:hypothetical protein
MGKLSDQLRAIRVFNNYDLLMQFGRPDDIAIEYYAPSPRACEAHRTKVWSPRRNAKLNDDLSAIAQSYSKTFVGLKRDTFWVAVQWAMDEFGHDYVPSPFGGYIPKHLKSKAMQAVTKK